jgi:hypothetical protein
VQTPAPLGVPKPLQMEPKGETPMKLQTGISPNYIPGWDGAKALREIIQNYLDTLQEFKCRGRITWAKGYATVKDNGPGLEMKHFALGISEKSDTAKGQFGEGLKLALLVLTREGREVEIQTKNQVIRPEIVHDPNYKTDILVLDVQPSKRVFRGTTIRVACSEAELAEAKGYFVEFMKDQFIWMDKDKISSPSGFLYLNGTRIGQIPNSLFSYHLSGKWGNLGNRDREVVNINLVRPAISRILSETKSNQVITAVFQTLLAKRKCEEIWAGVDYHSIPANRRKVWKKLFTDAAGGKVVLSSGDSAIDLMVRDLGYNVVDVGNWEWARLFQMLGIPLATKILENRSKKSPRVPTTQWTETETRNFRTARRLVKKHYHDPGKVTVVTEITGISADNRTVGFYDREKDQIFLRRSVLSSLERTLHTLLHETVHKYSGESDNTREFEWALLEVAVGMIMKRVRK